MKLTDTFPNHPKVIRAAELLGGGPDDRARVVALYVTAIGYARHFLTDGFVSLSLLKNSGVCSDVTRVANVLADRRVRLLERDKSGYRIHDWFEFNESAERLKKNRESNRRRVAAWRKKANGNGHA